MNTNQPPKPLNSPVASNKTEANKAAPQIKPLSMNDESNAKTNNGLKIWGGIGVLVLVGVKLMGNFGLGVLVSSGEAELSKFDKWDHEFRSSFIDGCNQEATKSIEADGRGKFTPEQIKAMAASYCDCMTNKVEAAHVLKTKYNSITQNKEDVEKELVAAVDVYLQSPEGKVALNSCFAVANGTAPEAN